jgi:predicted nucleic acid-binding protein
MIVLDASALLELLLGTVPGQAVAARIADPALGLHVPHLADVEIAQALRRYVREGGLDPESAAAAIQDLRALDLERHPHRT